MVGKEGAADVVSGEGKWIDERKRVRDEWKGEASRWAGAVRDTGTVRGRGHGWKGAGTGRGHIDGGRKW